MNRFKRHPNNKSIDSIDVSDLRDPIPIFGVPLSRATIASRLLTTPPLAHSLETGAAPLTDQQFVQLYKFWCPAVVIRTLDYLNAHGLEEEGLYRIPGSSETIKWLRNEFNRLGDVCIDRESDTKMRDLQTADIASLFKSFLRELPSPIITADAVTELEVDLTNIQHIRTTLARMLDPYEFYLLSLLCDHLCRVNSRAAKNKMDTSNLAIVFCSSSNLGIGANIFAALVQYEVWADLRSEKEALALQSEDADEIQPPKECLTPTSAQIAAAVFN